jgi:hypothetical protein
MAPKAGLTWLQLQDKLAKATEKQCMVLLKEEQDGKKRVQYLLRIYGRFNVLRTTRERSELLK